MIDELRPEERTWAALTHVLGLTGGFIPLGNIFGPLIMWQLKKDESHFVDQNGKSALNFQISYTIYMFVLAAIIMGTSLSTIIAINESNSLGRDFPLGFIMPAIILGVIALLQFILLIIATFKASNGQAFEYPFTIKFFK